MLGDLGDRRVVEPLIQTLRQDKNKFVRVAAAWALDELGDRRAVEPLIQALQQDNSWHVCEAAAKVLGDLGDRRVVEPLIQTLQQHDSSLVREAAAGALGKLAVRLERWDLVRELVAYPEVVKAIVEELEQEGLTDFGRRLLLLLRNHPTVSLNDDLRKQIDAVLSHKSIAYDHEIA